MINLPLEILNQIAATGVMQTQTLREICRLTSEPEAEQAMKALAAEQVGSNNPLEQQAFLQATFLLRENVAISKWLAKGHQEMRPLLPEILTAGEAVSVAQADYMLNARQVKLLNRLLLQPMR